MRDDLAAGILESGGSRAEASIARAVPEIGSHSNGRLYGDAFVTAMSPFSSLRHILTGDLRRAEDRPWYEQAGDVGGDVFAFGGASGLAEKGAAYLGELGVKGARALAERGAMRGLARWQVGRALAKEMGRYGVGSAVESGLRAVARRAGAMTVENVSLQAVPALNRADDLAMERGGSVLSHVPQAALEAAKGLASLYDPRTVFDASKSPAERAQSAIALLGAGLAGYGRLREPMIRAGSALGLRDFGVGTDWALGRMGTPSVWTTTDGRNLKAPNVPWEIGSFYRNRKGEIIPMGDAAGVTEADGKIIINNKYLRSARERGISQLGTDPRLRWFDENKVIPALRHEAVHRFFSPKFGLTKARAYVAEWAYNRSHLLKYLEESLAQSYATGSLKEGFGYALKPEVTEFYGLSPDRIKQEAKLYGLMLLTGMGAGYLKGQRDVNSSNDEKNY